MTARRSVPIARSESPNPLDEEERRYRTTIGRILAERGEAARELIPAFAELGRYYLANERCPDAVTAFEHAIRVSRGLDGLFHPTQLGLLEPLRECYVALDRRGDLERIQQHALLIHEGVHGKDNLSLLPALDDAARWYEQAGLYERARGLYARAMQIVRQAGGDDDLRLVAPLRRIAASCRLENRFQRFESPVDPLGERSLRRAVAIVRAHPKVAVRSASKPSSSMPTGCR